MKKFYTYILVTFFFSANAQQETSYPEQMFGKTIATSFKASPDVQAFQVRSINSVNNYTGAIDLEIPIFEIEMDGLKIPISIQYNSKGVKVDDISSSVGMNWSLNAGGNIVRVVKDIPDHKVGWYCFSEYDWDLGVYLTPRVGSIGANRRRSYFFRNMLAWGATDRFAIYSENDDLTLSNDILIGSTSLSKRDSNFDEYHVKGPSLKDVFILKNISASSDPFVPGYDATNLRAYFRDNLGNKLKSVSPAIVTSSGNGFATDLEYDHPYIINLSHYGMNSKKLKDFFNFELVNDKGFTFIFNDYDVVENFFGAFFNETTYIPNYTRTVLANAYNKDVVSWHLNKILSPYGVKSVDFEYENYNHSTVEKKRQLISRAKTVNNSIIVQASVNHEEVENYGGLENFESGRNWEKIPRKNRLKKILFPEGRVEFLYAGNRLDYVGDSRLAEIKVYNLHGNLIKHVQLNQVYFNTKDGTVGPLNHRMFLESVVVNNLTDNSQPEVYRFEYNDPDMLPKRYSNEQDFLGYFNNNGNTSNEAKTPRLYYYPNIDQPKFLPFSLLNQLQSVNIPGDYSLQPHVNSLYGLLNRISYPTKGYTTYEYQHDSFKIANTSVTAGSARVKSQKIYDSNNELVNEVAYDYPNNNGHISSFPILALLESYSYNPVGIKSVMTYNMPKSGIELTQGSFVGYANVRERHVKSNITKEYDYTTPFDNPLVKNDISLNNNITARNISIMNEVLKNKIPYHLNDFKNGKLKEVRIFSENTLKSKTTNVYKLFKSSVHSITTDNPFQSYNPEYYDFDYKSKSFFNQEFLGLDKSFLIEYEGNQNYTVEKNYTYKTTNSFLSPNYYPFVASEILKTANSENKTEYLYPFGNLFIGTLPYPTELSSENRLSDPYTTIFKRNDKIVKRQNILFNNFSYNNGNIMWFPRTNISTIQENFMNTVNEDQIVVDYRDEYGNIVTYHTADNIYFTAIWGYKGSYPLVEIKNAKFQDLDITKVNNIRTISDTGSGNAETLISAIMDLKSSLPANTFLEYKIYKPLVGVTIKGDINGKRTYYNYDGLNRLIKIYDDNLNIIKEYEYSYE